MQKKTNEDKGRKVHSRNFFTEPVFLLTLFVLGIIFVYVWLAKFGSGLEKYTDIVCEYTSKWNSNKTGERNLVYALAILGSAAMFIYFSLLHGRGRLRALKNIENKKEKTTRVLILAFVVALGTMFLVYSTTNLFLVSSLLLLLAVYVIDRERAYAAFVLFILGLYTVAGLYRLYVLFGGVAQINVMAVIILSLLLSIATLLFSRNNPFVFSRVFLIVQLMIPLTMLVFLASKYKVGEEIQVLNLPKRITCLVWVLIAAFVFLAAYNLKNKWNGKGALRTAFSFGTLVCVAVFNNFSGSGQIISSDLHHPFENIIGFSQIFELGQMPFSEYIPVSGMHSVLQGAFLWFFGKGTYAYYYVTENIFYLVITVFLIWILRKHLSDDKVLLVAVLLPILRYNRVALIIPFMLLLSWPKLIAKKNLWLKVWLLTSLVNGLYYPVFGAAVCLGFLPLAIYQAVSFLKGDFVAEKKNRKFWIGWIVCLLPILLCIPLLLGTLKHMLAMAGQTVFADGIARFGQTLPAAFFGYIQSIGARLLAYDAATFLIQATVVWVSVYLTIRVGKAYFGKKIKSHMDVESAALSISFGIAVLISFTYTLIRIDVDSIYSRSAGIIYGSVMMILILANRYLKDKKALFIFVGLAVFFVSFVKGEAIFGFDSANKLNPYYTVKENYVFADDGSIPKLGQCFVAQDTYDSIVSTYDSIKNHASDQGYVGIGNFGHFYLSNIKGDSVMETYTIRGYGAAQETVDIIRKENTIVAPVDSLEQYYLYKWLLQSGEYVWSAENGNFYPNTEGLSAEEVRNKNKDIGLAGDGRDLGRTPTSWGSSMESLEKIMTQIPVDTKISNTGTAAELSFGEPIQGEDADFLYIEFSGVDTDYTPILFNHGGDVVQEKVTWFNEKLMKRDYNRGKIVTILWSDDGGNRRSMFCALGRGKLLIPLGSGCNWLLNQHDGVSITMRDGEETIEIPDISEVKLLKVREVE